MKAFFEWFRNVWLAVTTVAQGMWITLRTMTKTYERKSFAEIYEYPETPVPVKARSEEHTSELQSQ